MLQGILSIAGKPGLFRLVSRGKSTIIVEALATGKRTPVQVRDRVISLADVSMYTTGDDVALGDVLTSLHTVAEGKPVDGKAMTDTELREYFGKVLPDFDRDRVHNSDIRKLLSWYNILIAAGITEFNEPQQPETPAE
ncbi:MAG: DUF5606 domain-containing protein [Muribaculaceae bacterium]|nr:DUF5606 domain-containing protein [Muribaculaceae bacterium]